MESPRKWMAELMLRAPAPLRSLRDVPVVGPLIHGVSHRVLPADEKVWARVEAGPARGLWLKLNPRTGQSYLRGDAEPTVQAILQERLRGGMVFYDLGANIGLFSLLAARLVGSQGKVFSFEPDATVASRLRENAARNGFANITVVEAGVWSRSGAMNFESADASSPDQGVGRFVADGSGNSGIARPCVALDDFVQQAPQPDLIKCDVEGAEVEVFLGAEKMLRERRPSVICEMHSEENEKALRTLFRNARYEAKPIDANHILATRQGGE
ncbi:MAG TPA: FkbM family methyltransferase [Candidatus Sulfotelmatobacter sp.]|nr:FkbM family methyltransferase [Candidatus Sulfotelmatobacter sp.]